MVAIDTFKTEASFTLNLPDFCIPTNEFGRFHGNRYSIPTLTMQNAPSGLYYFVVDKLSGNLPVDDAFPKTLALFFILGGSQTIPYLDFDFTLTRSPNPVGLFDTISVTLIDILGQPVAGDTFTFTTCPPLQYLPASLVATDFDGVFGVTPSRQIIRSYWRDGQWHTEEVWDVHSNGHEIVGSLIKGSTTGTFNALVFGVMTHGDLCVVSNVDGSIRETVIPMGATPLVPGSLAMSNGNGVFGVTVQGDLIHVWYGPDGWEPPEIIQHWGGNLASNSLITGEPGPDGNIYGVNSNGVLFATWDPGVITFATIDVTSDLVPESIAMSNGNGIFGITTHNDLVRAYYSSGGWHLDEIVHWGGGLVPNSLITGDAEPNDNVYGVNSAGRLFTTWKDAGINTFATIDVTSDLVPESIAMSNGNGIFGITTGGALVRAYYKFGGWHQDTIVHWGGNLVAESLVTGGPGPDGNVYGVNQYGQLFATWRDPSDGVIKFATIN